MKIEKLNEDKIRITLNLEELKNKNVDFHSFMSNPIETQSFFLDMLDEAEKEIGFSTENYKISIEALAMSNGNFVFTVTRLQEEVKKLNKKRLHIKKKNDDKKSDTAIFEFEDFENFCSLCTCLNKLTINFESIMKNNVLYKYNDKYYLVLKNNIISPSDFETLNMFISEFAKLIPREDIFENMLKEYGKLIIKSNAIKVGIKYFNNK